jgi:hypothetical protein
MSIVDKVKAFFDGLEGDLHGVLGTHVAQDTIDAAKADVSKLVEQGKEQVTELVAEAEADAKTDASTVAGDVKDLAENPPNGVPTGTPAGQPAAAQTVDNPQNAATVPANPAETTAAQTPSTPDQAPASQVPAQPTGDEAPTA